MSRIKIKVGGNPYKGKVSFSTRCYMKWKRIEFWWRRWRDPEIRLHQIKEAENNHPFRPKKK